MLIGFAERDITPPVGKLIPGGFDGKVTTKPARGKLLVTAAAFTSGEESMILVSVDTLSMQVSFADRIRNRISAATGVPFDRIMIVSTHIHTGGATDYQLWLCPPDPEVAALTEEGTVSAAIAAWEARSEGKLGVGKGEEKRYSFCRDIYMKDGTIQMNPSRKHPELMIRPVDTPDYAVNVMRVDDMEGNVRAFLVNYANHPDCHAKNKESFSADFPGALRRNLKRVHGEELKVLFFNGTAGDINCIDWMGNTTDPYYGGTRNAPEAIGLGLASTVLQIDIGIKADVTEPVIGAVSRNIQTERRYKTEEDVAWAREIAKDMASHSVRDRAFATEYLESDDDVKPIIDFEVHTMRLGPWAIVGLPSEIFTDIGRRIKNGSPFEHTVVFELANGTHGYVATDIIHKNKAYETTISKINACTAANTADLIVDAALAQLWELAGREQ
ncbi:MAG: hypothetical protein IJX39_09485 [Clostridia bacterium]|nr:hypothetical protein [Clostridia bacterium]